MKILRNQSYIFKKIYNSSTLGLYKESRKWLETKCIEMWRHVKYLSRVHIFNEITRPKLCPIYKPIINLRLFASLGLTICHVFTF